MPCGPHSPRLLTLAPRAGSWRRRLRCRFSRAHCRRRPSVLPMWRKMVNRSTSCLAHPRWGVGGARAASGSAKVHGRRRDPRPRRQRRRAGPGAAARPTCAGRRGRLRSGVAAFLPHSVLDALWRDLARANPTRLRRKRRRVPRLRLLHVADAQRQTHPKLRVRLEACGRGRHVLRPDLPGRSLCAGCGCMYSRPRAFERRVCVALDRPSRQHVQQAGRVPLRVVWPCCHARYLRWRRCLKRRPSSRVSSRSARLYRNPQNTQASSQNLAPVGPIFARNRAASARFTARFRGHPALDFGPPPCDPRTR